MPQTTLDEAQIKELFKQALVELLQERKDLLREVIAEVLEDLALLRAIKEGEDTETVGKEDVLRALEK